MIKIKRNSKFEALRLLSMLFIILSHYSLETHWNVSGKDEWKVLFYQPFGQIGVDLFVMISGYFLSTKSKEMGEMVAKDIRLWVKVLFYSWLMLIFTYFIEPSLINSPRLLRGIFPVTLNGYWFITSFLLLMIFVPMINGFINNSRFIETIFLFIIILGTSGIQSILPLGFTPFGGTLNLGIMIAAYLYAAILRKYSLKIKPIFTIALLIMGLICEYIGMLYLHYKPLTNGIAPFLSAMAIFYWVVNSKDFYCSSINWIAASMFASYLILCNSFANSILWNVILHTSKYADHPLLPGLLICSLLIVVTVLIDKVYIYFENRFFMNLFKKIDYLLISKK